MFFEFMDKLLDDLHGSLPAGQGCFKTHQGTCLARKAMKGLACCLTGALTICPQVTRISDKEPARAPKDF